MHGEEGDLVIMVVPREWLLEDKPKLVAVKESELGVDKSWTDEEIATNQERYIQELQQTGNEIRGEVGDEKSRKGNGKDCIIS